jgi:Na+-translocating ferredoxin:NAD+ oxidoreductase RnfD subunit
VEQTAPIQPLSLNPNPADDFRPAPPFALRSPVGVSRFYITYMLGAGFPAVTGLLLYGWLALLVLFVILPTTFVAYAVWRRIGARGRQLHPVHTFYLALLLWLMLPAHLLAGTVNGRNDLWAIPVVAAVILVIAMWLLGGVGFGRIHPLLVTYLLLVIAFDQLLVPVAVLQRHRSITGDLARAAPPATTVNAYVKEGYLKTPHVDGADALLLEPAETRLLAYTSGQKRPGRSWASLESLLRDELPPLEDLIIGGQPGPIGGTCAVAIIIGGLYLLYRGIIDFRVPLAAFAGAFVALLTLPVPIRITDDGPDFRWLVFRAHRIITPTGPRFDQIGWAKAVTFANYEIMVGPMLLMIFFLATAPALRPMARRARVIYGLLVGILAAGLQLYVSISYGPYLALLIISLLTPLLDRHFRPHTLV